MIAQSRAIATGTLLSFICDVVGCCPWQHGGGGSSGHHADT
jgi:hypothetical protein